MTQYTDFETGEALALAILHEVYRQYDNAEHQHEALAREVAHLRHHINVLIDALPFLHDYWHSTKLGG